MKTETVVLTGQTRYRAQHRLFRKEVLVLQVEERITGSVFDIDGYGPEYSFTQWRDAATVDMHVNSINRHFHLGIGQ